MSLPIFVAKAFSFDPSPVELLLLFLLIMVPVIFFIVNSFVLLVNLKRHKASLRMFGYIALAWQGLATLFWIIKMPWIGLIALALVAVQGFVTLRTF